MDERSRSSEGYGTRLSRADFLSSDHRNSSMKMSSLEEQVDSGLGSLGYHSLELQDSLPHEDKRQQDTPNSALADRGLNSTGSTDLEKSLSRLNIGSLENKLEERCDSGVAEDSDSLQKSRPCLIPYPDHPWVSPHLSPSQLIEVFKGDEDGDNHLHLSIIHNLPELTMQIIGLAPGYEWLNQTNNLQQTPLHIAVLTRQAAIVRRLVCAGASVDVRDQIGNTPLHSACGLGYNEIARELLTPVKLEETYQNKYKIPYQRIPQDLEMKNYEGLTCFHLSAFGGHNNMMRLLLTAGANINAAEGKSGRTVLHFAADWGNISMADFLLSHRDVDINAKTYSGLTPLLLAYGRQHEALAEFLYSKGALVVDPLGEDCDTDASDEEMASEKKGLYQQRQPQLVY